MLWFPHIIVKMPGAFSADTRSQIMQALGLEYWTSHHPVFMTWILKICLGIGKNIFSSYRVGILLFFFLQTGLMILIFSYTIYFLEIKGIPKAYRNLLWAVYAFCPYIVGYIGVILKDVPYSAVFLWFVISLIHFLEADRFRIDRLLLLELTVSSVLTILGRNNGKEIVYPTLLLIGVLTIWNNKSRWKYVFMGVTAVILPVLCAAVISEGLMRHYDIIPGSIREALSMPFQQTARTAREHGEEIPEDERKAIDAILQYDSLAERYNPIVSDPVKNMYRDGASKQEKLSYAKVWLKQLGRYPLTYIEAAMHQNYLLFDLLANYQNFYFRSTVQNESGGGEILIEEYPVIGKIEVRFVSFYKLCSDLPIIGIFARSSFYCVLLVVLTVFVWRDKKYKILLALFPMWLTIGICILGPVIKGNPRYTFPVIYSIPLVFGYYIVRSKIE